jgi:flagellar motor protein MotB
MKIITYILIALLIITLGAGAFFFLNLYTPMAEDYARMKAGMPELDKAKAELKKLKEKDAQHAKEVAWIAPAADLLKNGLADEIKAGKAEIVAAGNALVINIAEDALYTPGSKTFAKDTQTRLKLTGLLKHDALKGKVMFVGNATDAVAAHGKGKKKVPAKEALALASERSFEMVKALIRDGVPQESLAALAYPAKLPDHGFTIKHRKTMIVIGAHLTPAPSQTPSVPIPVQPAQPK